MFQSCTVYRSANVSLEDAVKSDLKVKVTFDNGKKAKYKRVILADDGQFYGKKFKKGKETFLIEENELKKVQLQDKTNSIILSIVAPIVITGIILGLWLNETSGGFPY